MVSDYDVHLFWELLSDIMHFFQESSGMIGWKTWIKNEIIIAKRDRCECSNATVEIKVKMLDSQTYTLRVDKCVSIFISWSSMLLILFGVKNGQGPNNSEVVRLQMLIFSSNFYDGILKRKVQSGGNIIILYFCI